MIAAGFFFTRLLAWALLGPVMLAQAAPQAPASSHMPASPPQRIITIGPSAAEIICALGACDRIVGVDKYCVYPPELKTRPRVGGLFDPNLERITFLRPDLVVLRGHVQAVEDLCDELNIRLYLDKTDTLSDMVRCVDELATLLGRREQGRRVIRRFRERIKAIRRRVAGRPKPRVLLTAARSPDKLTNILTFGKGTFPDEMIDIAGGVNVFGDLDAPYPQVSLESIVNRRPEVIIELMPEQRLDESDKAELRAQWSRLGLIPAVQSGRIRFITADHALIPSLRYVEIVDRVSRILHPDPIKPADGP